MAITVFHLPVEIIEGPGSVERLADLAAARTTALVTDRGLADNQMIERIALILGSKVPTVLRYSDIDSDPDEAMVLRLVAFLKDRGVEQVVAVGGGSPLDTAKAAVCLTTNEGSLEEYQWEGRAFEHAPLPLFVVPTTAGTGSEVSGVAVIGSRNTKKGLKHPFVFAKTAIVDPELMLGLPPFLTAVTGMDALTHAVEAYIGLNRNPLVQSLAESAIRLACGSLREAVTDGKNIRARTEMAQAAMMAGIAMDLGGLGIVHSLSAPLCSNLHVAHGLGNTFLLPYGLEYNMLGNEETFSRLAVLMGGTGPDFCARLVLTWQAELGLQMPLADVAQKLRDFSDIDWLGGIGAKMFLMKNNPRAADATACSAIFKRAAGL